MRLVYTGDKEGLRGAAEYVTRLFANGAFWAEIEAHGPFDLTSFTGAQVAGAMKSYSGDIRIKERFTIYPKVNAWTKASDPGILYYSRFKTGRPVASIVNTFVHEVVHLVDHADSGEFGHGGNESDGKDGCAPNWIGDLAERFYRESR